MKLITGMMPNNIQNNETRRQYKHDLQRFADYCRSDCKIREMRDLPEDHAGRVALVNAYVQRLAERHLSAATIHTYVAPVCRGLGLSMADVDKPKRKAIEVTKSRDDVANSQGRTEAGMDRYARLVDFAQAAGLRRSEYTRLIGASVGVDVCGVPCITVRGKGGKVQHQRLVGTDVDTVRRIISDVSHDQHIFTSAEMTNKIDLHGIRASHARAMYDHYVREIKAGRGDQLRAKLLDAFAAYHPDGRNPRRQAAFLAQIDRSGGVYRVRGDNRTRAIASGQTGSYDRLALLCVSVWHLAHWRLDVTVRHYML